MILKDGLLNELTRLLKKSYAIAAILFGSIARGNFDRRSDIDILLIYRNKGDLDSDKHLFDRLPLVEGREIQIVARTLDELKDSDKVFLSNVFKEGVLLFVREPLGLKASDLLGLKPYRIFIYSMKGLDADKKKRLIVTLYGYSTKKKVGEKRYEYEYRGLVDREMKLGKNSFLIEEERAKDIENILRSYGVKFRSISVWLSIETLKILIKINNY